VERDSTCSTTSPTRRSIGSALPMRKRMTALNKTQDRGSKGGSHCSIWRISSTGGSR
jgi:hypothetical protein